jgi:hypothetical protein
MKLAPQQELGYSIFWQIAELERLVDARSQG